MRLQVSLGWHRASRRTRHAMIPAHGATMPMYPRRGSRATNARKGMGMQASSMDARTDPPEWLQPWLAGLFVVVALTALAGLLLAADKISAAPIWYANGILLGVMLRVPWRHWTAIVVAGVIGIVAARLLVEQSAVLAIGLALCSALEVVLAAWAIRRHTGDEDLDPERLLRFTRIGVLWSVLAPIASGVFAALLFWYAKSAPPWEEFATWY